METTVLSGRDFNQYASEAKRAANKGLVFITDRGRPSHVLMSIEYYNSIKGNNKKIADLLAMPEDTDFDFEIPSFHQEIAKPASL